MDRTNEKKSFIAEVSILCKDPKEAVSILDSVDADNEGYVSVERVGSRIIFKCSFSEIGRLKNTLDDLLACLSLSERIIDMSSDRSD